MRITRSLLRAAVVLGLALVGLALAPVFAEAADLTDIQAGLITGVVITWATFQVNALLSDAEPAATHQD
ncbi:hypothetical protein PUR59_00490 [Streptomyces sp. SP18ES09]|uniref:hypothetical protein n=1 Tax=Streptomyces sp. SP18ES09 TaxID=3002532 RepID=UPI002E760AED|nr:hypothetical protein [Streptomyces sp. SP18ES09]MEE1813529.1 hypothetical protein [Streptomyces sp. SP18ES09]